ncbi:expressed unknown protein [Ectocarpus siliculosus]|uniref:Uncharacterized protein n=1 Tax=Ectocarpus siliculosus TaxID=2880 RepID=D8LIT2_ECTSI|nr:expressed unknown protein [Ectocarpus siliculosus]|eukprot:CBN76816.1 expressed unknown protein [Ectocarpus siliculosus]
MGEVPIKQFGYVPKRPLGKRLGNRPSTTDGLSPRQQWHRNRRPWGGGRIAEARWQCPMCQGVARRGRGGGPRRIGATTSGPESSSKALQWAKTVSTKNAAALGSSAEHSALVSRPPRRHPNDRSGSRNCVTEEPGVGGANCNRESRDTSGNVCRGRIGSCRERGNSKNAAGGRRGGEPESLEKGGTQRGPGTSATWNRNVKEPSGTTSIVGDDSYSGDSFATDDDTENISLEDREEGPESRASRTEELRLSGIRIEDDDATVGAIPSTVVETGRSID